MDERLIYIIAHHRNGMSGARNLYIERVYESRDGELQIRWTENKGDAKAWATEWAAQRNATHLGRVVETYR